MASELVIRGLPRGLDQDAWWFCADTPPGGVIPPDGTTRVDDRSWRSPWILAALVALADLLFWDHALGISLPIFALSVFAAAAAGRPWRAIRRPLALVALSALPAVDYVQTLSVLFLVAGLVAGIGWLHLAATGGAGRILGYATALILSIPLRGPRDLWHSLSGHGGTGGARVLRQISPVRDWGLPIGGALILVALLVDANPIIAGWIAGLLEVDIDWIETGGRLVFWGGTALIVWPLISSLAREPALPGIGWAMRAPAAAWINPGAVLRALVLFNLVLGIQTVMDATLLWGGGALPEGMGYAEYAHRGAYPLLVTALLAGGFALVTRPFLGERPYLQPLVLLWLVQNIALCISSAKRLDLYVDAFGLTYLRVHVMIWIGVVAIGLGLIAWQIWQRKTTFWLLLRWVLLGVGVLYAASFVNFANIIATRNLNAASQPIDWQYLCDLPDVAAPVIRASDAFARSEGRVRYECATGPEPIEDWRDWGFRRWRAAANIVPVTRAEVENEDTGGR